MNRTAIIFPGQGAQRVGMGKDVAETSEAARRTYATADAILGWPLSKICFEGPAERLCATDISQPAIFVTSVALWRAWEAGGITGEFEPQAMAGLSLGEYTALHLAGWMEFEATLKLVAERGRLMQSASVASEGAMVSAMGLDEAAVLGLCDEASEGEVLGPANYNCPGQIVISGAKTACERAVSLAERLGGRAVMLTVSGAFHSSLMAPAVEGLAAILGTTEIHRGRIGVVSNVSAGYHAGPEGVRDLLREQVVKPVRWQASMEGLIADGFDRFVEVGPGRVLTGLMKKIDRSVTAWNFSNASSLAKVLA